MTFETASPEKEISTKIKRMYEQALNGIDAEYLRLAISNGVVMWGLSDFAIELEGSLSSTERDQLEELLQKLGFGSVSINSDRSGITILFSDGDRNKLDPIIFGRRKKSTPESL